MLNNEGQRLIEADNAIESAFARDRARLAKGAVVPGEGLIAALAASRSSTARHAPTPWYRSMRGYIVAAAGLVGMILGVVVVAPFTSEEDHVESSVAQPPRTTATTADRKVPLQSARDMTVSDSVNAAGAVGTERVSMSNASTSRASVRAAVPSAPISRDVHANRAEPSRTQSPVAAPAVRTDDIDSRSVESLPERVESTVEVEVHVKGK